MTVSAPATFASGSASSDVAPKSRVTVSATGASGLDPAPAPQPAERRARRAPQPASALLADMEDDAVAAAPARVVAVEGLVDRVDVEHVAPARQPRGQQVVDRAAVADGEPRARGRAAAGLVVEPEALEAAAEVRAAPAVVARQAQLDGEQPRRVGRDLRAQPARPGAAREALALRDPDDRRRRRRPVETRGSGAAAAARTRAAAAVAPSPPARRRSRRPGRTRRCPCAPRTASSSRRPRGRSRRGRPRRWCRGSRCRSRSARRRSASGSWTTPSLRSSLTVTVNGAAARRRSPGTPGELQREDRRLERRAVVLDEHEDAVARLHGVRADARLRVRVVDPEVPVVVVVGVVVRLAEDRLGERLLIPLARDRLVERLGGGVAGARADARPPSSRRVVDSSAAHARRRPARVTGVACAAGASAASSEDSSVSRRQRRWDMSHPFREGVRLRDGRRQVSWLPGRPSRAFPASASRPVASARRLHPGHSGGSAPDSHRTSLDHRPMDRASVALALR